MFNARGGISILELIFYIPSLITAIFICARHGFGKNSGWIFLVIFSLARVLGACCQLGTYSSNSTSLETATLVLNLLGLTPLLLATLGLLSRV